ncbi:MAG: hypothetical protein JSU63_20870 [Phycisphaerales bacterium]|nr:MAG: hypothetical protein JSU63_20870 [Phycisphaerales bacterium]
MRSTRYLYIAAAILLAVASSSSATLPDDVSVEYKIHKTPTDPDSDVLFVVTLYLSADDELTEEIGWAVTQIDVKQIGYDGAKDHTWTEYNPDVDTPDGLWWVEHADKANPVLAEFLVPPLIEGTGSAADKGRYALTYSWEGDVYTEPPGGGPYEPTAAATYRFVEDEEEVGSGEEEPVEPDGVFE